MPTPHLSDEQLSDVVDAGLGRRDLPGPDPVEYDDHLAGCSDCRGRVADLVEARNLLRALPPLDELTRQRLVSKALHVGARQQPRRWAILVGAAAALAALVGTPLLIGGGGRGEQMALRQATSGESAVAGRFLGDLGALGDEASLLAVLRQRPDTDLSGSSSRARQGAGGAEAEATSDEAFNDSAEPFPAAEPTPEALTAPQAPSPSAAGDRSKAKSATPPAGDNASDTQAIDPTVAAFACANRAAGGSTVAFVGTLRYQGVDAFV
ncbi:MAG: hypothetical protein ACRDV9_09190, partial [Acidimicrobiia bacterium]